MSVAALQQALAVVRGLPDRLEAEPGVPDAEVVAAVDRLDAHMQTNCVSWAEGMFAAVAPLCARRPHLAPALLRHAYLSLVYLGHESFEQTRGFVEWLLAQPSTYMLPLRPEGRAWLAEEYPKHAAALQPVMAELVRQAQQDAEPLKASVSIENEGIAALS